MENTRYSLVNIFDNDIWVPESPVEVLQGALIMDNLIGQNCLQLSLRSTAEKRISTVYVDLTCLGSGEKPLFDEPIGIILRDVAASKGAVFGENETYYLHSGKVETVKCAVTRVIFSDGTVWRSKGEPVTVVAHKFDELNENLKAIFYEILADSVFSGLETEYKFLPRQDEDFWVCTCGRPNSNGTSECQRCGMNRTWIMQNLNIMYLRQKMDERVAKARHEAEEERRREMAAKQAAEALAQAQIAREQQVQTPLQQPIEQPQQQQPVQQFAAQQESDMAVQTMEIRQPAPMPQYLQEQAENEAIIEEYEQSEKTPILRYIILGVLGVVLVGIGTLIFLIATNRISFA